MSSLESRIDALEKASAAKAEPEPWRIRVHPDPCPEAGPDGQCPCSARARAAGRFVVTLKLDTELGEPGEGVRPAGTGRNPHRPRR